MQVSNIPSKFNIGFASSAGASYIRTIPQTPTGTAGQASLQQGFPPENFQPVAAGGVPPFGQDFNGLLNQITLWSQWQAAGGGIPYDATFQTEVGGYPQGARVNSLVTVGLVWESIVDNNLTNPDAGGAGWICFSPISVANPTLWVRSDGNDNNSGGANTAAAAFLTIQSAINAAANRLNLTGRTLTINIGLAGTYAGAAITTIPNIAITSAGPAGSFIINNVSGSSPVFGVSGCSLTLSNVTISNTTSTQHSLDIAYGASVSVSAVTFGGTAGGSGIADIRCFSGGSAAITGAVSFARNAGAALWAQGSGASISSIVGSTITCSGNAWGTAGLVAVSNGSIELSGTAPTGSATGVRYSASLNGVINTFGGGANYWPGGTAGSTATGGQYA